VIAEKFPFKTSLATCSSYFLESQFKGFLAMLFLSLLSISSILGTVSIILSSLEKVDLVKVQASLGVTEKINHTIKMLKPKPANQDIQPMKALSYSAGFVMVIYFYPLYPYFLTLSRL